MKSCWLCIVLGLLLLSQVQAQSPASIVVLPHKPMTYEDALQIIGKELGVHVGHVPDIAELKDSCTVYGKMTFGKFFEPLKARGLLYHFMADDFNQIKHLIIIGPPPTRKMLRIWAQEAETGYPLPGVTVKNLTTGKITFTDNSGMACFPNDDLPVDLLLTYVGRRSLYITVRQDSMPIPLEIDAESLGAATVSAVPVKKAFATLTSSTLVNARRVNSSYRSTRTLPGVSSSTIQTMLEGQMPGVLTTSTTGVPGGSSYVSVRGQASIVNGIDPYYVIDGVPSAAGNASVSYIPSGNASGSLSSWTFIAPGNIERVDVLRDADATAIYGSRGANGVVLITTRHWRAGLPKWDVEVSTGTSMVMKQPRFLNTPEYLAMRREALQNSGLPDSTAPDLTGPDTLRNFDWGKWLLGRQSRCANVKFAVSGGRRKNSYTVGMDYFREATPFPAQPDHDRWTTDFN